MIDFISRDNINEVLVQLVEDGKLESSASLEVQRAIFKMDTPLDVTKSHLNILSVIEGKMVKDNIYKFIFELVDSERIEYSVSVKLLTAISELNTLSEAAISRIRSESVRESMMNSDMFNLICQLTRDKAIECCDSETLKQSLIKLIMDANYSEVSDELISASNN